MVKNIAEKLQNATVPSSNGRRKLIEFKEVHKIYELGVQKIHALENINFSIYPGEFITIVGPSGSGKSTFLNLVGLIDSPTKGILEYEGVDVAKMSDDKITAFRNQKVGIVFQNYNLIPVLNSVENVAFALQVQGVGKKESINRAKDLLQEVGLGNHFNHRPGNLSGGQRQRVAIARALVTQPEIVIADEPTAALDGKTGRGIIELMQKLNAAKQTTFIFSTHDQRIIDTVDSVVEIEDGQIQNQ